MNLINILSAQPTTAEHVHVLTIIADIGDGPEELIFTYSPDDNHGLGPEVSAWLMSNPDFPLEGPLPPTQESS